MKLRCRLGLHQWYRDSVWTYSADRCNHCRKWRNAQAGERVERERDVWAKVPPGSWQEQARWVNEQLRQP